jgi:diacylglycerol kinase family enzyme
MHAQGKHIRIESSPEIPLEVDGELLGVTPIEFNVLHREVKVIVNRSFLDKLKK